MIHERLPGIAETARIFAGVDVTRQPIPVLPTCHYNMGGIPTNYHGEVVTVKDGDPDDVVPGLMAIGEAACVSVHGANRLGSNSLLDLVVFGRAAANRVAEQIDARRVAQAAASTPARRRSPASTSCAMPTAARRPPSCAPRCSTPCRTTARCSAPARPWPKAAPRWTRCIAGKGDIRVKDRSMIWNSDLVETLELENLLVQAMATIVSAANRTREPRRACARGLPGARRRELDEAHGGLGRRATGKTRIDYRPVNLQPLTNDVQSFPPKARVY